MEGDSYLFYEDHSVLIDFLWCLEVFSAAPGRRPTAVFLSLSHFTVHASGEADMGHASRSRSELAARLHAARVSRSVTWQTTGP